MDELSGDEFAVLLVSVFAAPVFLLAWGSLLLRPCPMGRRQPGRGVLAFLPLVPVVTFHLVLTRLADREVREHGVYEFLFVALGIAWLMFGLIAARLCGIGPRQQLVDQVNPAAAPVVGGAVFGVGMCFAGANVGGGATIWSTIVPAVLASVTWGALWLVADLLSGTSLAITIDRDEAAGWRVCGAVVASGIILGRAVAGDYHGADETLRDFVRQGLPAAVVMFILVPMHVLWRPTPRRTRPDVFLFGVFPAVGFFIVVIVDLLCLGWPEVKS